MEAEFSQAPSALPDLPWFSLYCYKQVCPAAALLETSKISAVLSICCFVGHVTLNMHSSPKIEMRIDRLFFFLLLTGFVRITLQRMWETTRCSEINFLSCLASYWSSYREGSLSTGLRKSKWLAKKTLNAMLFKVLYFSFIVLQINILFCTVCLQSLRWLRWINDRLTLWFAWCRLLQYADNSVSRTEQLQTRFLPE